MEIRSPDDQMIAKLRKKRGEAHLEALISRTANFYFLDPFGEKDLVSGQTTLRVRVKNRVYDIAALLLQHTGSVMQLEQPMEQLTRRRTSMGL